jgi:hypothetical protein
MFYNNNNNDNEKRFIFLVNQGKISGKKLQLQDCVSNLIFTTTYISISAFLTLLIVHMHKCTLSVLYSRYLW